MALSRRAKIGIIAGSAVVVVAVGALSIWGVSNKASADYADQADLYIEDYGLLLNYNSKPGELTYETKQDATGSYIEITNPALKPTISGCTDESDTVIGRIRQATTIGEGDDLPDAYIETADGYLVYEYPDSTIAKTDKCFDNAKVEASADQRESLFHSFNVVSSANDGDDVPADAPADSTSGSSSAND